jgi:hypothetical protein
MSIEKIIGLIIAGGGTATALVTFIRGTAEYRLQGRQKRAYRFFELRRALKENPKFVEVAALLDDAASGDPTVAPEANDKLQAIPFHIKRDYLGLFEEVALAVNSGLIRADVAHYMFGYYAILCEENDSFWHNVGRFSPYWSLFKAFYEQMKVEQGKLLSDSVSPSALQF